MSQNKRVREKNPNKNRAFGSASSCLVLVRNDRKFSKTQECRPLVIEPEKKACACGSSSILLVPFLWDTLYVILIIIIIFIINIASSSSPNTVLVERASRCIISCYYFVPPWGPACPHQQCRNYIKEGNLENMKCSFPLPATNIYQIKHLQTMGTVPNKKRKNRDDWHTTRTLESFQFSYYSFFLCFHFFPC